MTSTSCSANRAASWAALVSLKATPLGFGPAAARWRRSDPGRVRPRRRDNWAFGIDRDADHLGAGEFEHVENRREGRSLDDHSIAEVDGGVDQPVERILRSVEQGDSAGIERPSTAELDLERRQDGRSR